MQKTIKQWLEELPEPYRSKALKNHAENPCEGFYSDSYAPTFREALNFAFIWDSTSEGAKFWGELYTQGLPQPVSDFPTVASSETQTADGTLMTEGVLKHLSEGLTKNEAVEADSLDRSYAEIRRDIHKKLNALTPKPDPVNHPSHYTKGDIECIDALAAATIDLTGMEAVCTANAIKYLWRWKHKNGVEDLKKAKFYIDKLITDLEK